MGTVLERKWKIYPLFSLNNEAGRETEKEQRRKLRKIPKRKNAFPLLISLKTRFGGDEVVKMMKMY